MMSPFPERRSISSAETTIIIASNFRSARSVRQSFANSVAAPAIEYQREGVVTGVGARLFTLAGPVLAYGIASSVLVGVVYWFIRGWLM